MSIDTWSKEKSPRMTFNRIKEWDYLGSDQAIYDLINTFVNQAEPKYESARINSQSEPTHILWWVEEISNNEWRDIVKKYWLMSFLGRISGMKVDAEPFRKFYGKTTEQLIRLLPPEWSAFDDEWFFKDYVYVAKGEHSLSRGIYSVADIKLFILELYDKQKEKFEKLKNNYIFSEKKVSSYERPRIPEIIRIEVWRRDGGKCSRCGNRENLEFDHIVPISRGGSNTTRNIELLCEKCNRSKHNNVA